MSGSTGSGLGSGNYRPVWVEVDLGAIRHNVREIRRVLAPDVGLLAVVKASAYGHGDAQVSHVALEEGASWLGVALVEEGVRLREAGVTAPILLLSEPPADAAEVVLARSLTATVYTAEGIRSLAKAAGDLGVCPEVHIKVDTGMHRVGGSPEQALALAGLVLEEGMVIGGIWSHLAVADEPGNPFSEVQRRRFDVVCSEMEALGIRPRLRHLANSGATLLGKEYHYDLVRCGLAIYGYAPSAELAPAVDLRPAMTLKARVSLVKEVGAGEGVSYGLRYRPEGRSLLATVPIGYADGLPRGLSGRGVVLVGGKRRPIAGTITMDQVVLDCGQDRVEIGDEVVLLGEQAGERITAVDWAEALGTIAYEVLAGVRSRIPRVYVEGA
ncbi:MAG: alanine racemase [Actinomycetota bacterium]